MPALRLNEEEQGALLGLPHAARSLYLALRGRMDFSTGLVGIRPLISWFALAQDLYVEPAPGPRPHGRPHVESVRRLGRVLERAGLVRMRSTERPPRLVFRLILADVLSLALKKPDRNPTGQPDRSNGASHRGGSIDRSRKPDRGNATEPDTHPESGSTAISNRRLAARARRYNTPAAADLIFPKDATRAEIGGYLAIARKHELTRDELQLLLDELIGKLRRSTVANRPVFLESLARQLRAGDFYGLLAEGERGRGAGLSAAEARIFNERKR